MHYFFFISTKKCIKISSPLARTSIGNVSLKLLLAKSKSLLSRAGTWLFPPWRPLVGPSAHCVLGEEKFIWRWILVNLASQSLETRQLSGTFKQCAATNLYIESLSDIWEDNGLQRLQPFPKVILAAFWPQGLWPVGNYVLFVRIYASLSRRTTGNCNRCRSSSVGLFRGQAWKARTELKIDNCESAGEKARAFLPVSSATPSSVPYFLLLPR